MEGREKEKSGGKGGENVEEKRGRERWGWREEDPLNAGLVLSYSCPCGERRRQ